MFKNQLKSFQIVHHLFPMVLWLRHHLKHTKPVECLVARQEICFTQMELQCHLVIQNAWQMLSGLIRTFYNVGQVSILVECFIIRMNCNVSQSLGI